MIAPFNAIGRRILLASLCLTAGSQAGTELSLITARFESSGVDSDARGIARATFTPNSPKFRLDVWGLAPETEYQFTVDNVVEETITTDRRGGIHKHFRVAPGTNKLPLDFDPRGKVLGLSAATGEVLSVVFSGDDEPTDIRVDERTALQPTSETVVGRVRLRYLEQKNKDRLILFLQGADKGDYQVYVDGQLQEEISLTRGRSTTHTFELLKNGNANGGNSPKKSPLTFDPRGKIVDVVKDGVILFSGEMLAQIPALEVPQVGEASVTLAPTATDVDATGSALIAQAADGEVSLTVNVGAIPAGVYDVVIAGVVQGQLTVTGTEPDSTGTLTFSTNPEATELLLDFDALGQSIEIRQGTTVFLTGTLPGTLTEVAAPTAVKAELPLLNLTADLDASAHITLTTEASALTAVEVDLTSVAVGNYDFKVGTTIQGTVVVTDVDGVISGELVFGAGGETLDFDPRGQTVTVEQGGVVLLTRTLGL